MSSGLPHSICWHAVADFAIAGKCSIAVALPTCDILSGIAIFARLNHSPSGPFASTWLSWVLTSSVLLPQLALHYSGAAKGPVHSFGISIGDFAAESEHLLCADPALACARARVLEYFQQRNKGLAEDHLVLRFDEGDGVSAGDARLVRQLCVQVGFPRSASAERDAAAYLSGAAPELLDNYPELGMFRGCGGGSRATLRCSGPTRRSLPACPVSARWPPNASESRPSAAA